MFIQAKKEIKKDAEVLVDYEWLNEPGGYLFVCERRSSQCKVFIGNQNEIFIRSFDLPVKMESVNFSDFILDCMLFYKIPQWVP